MSEGENGVGGKLLASFITGDSNAVFTGRGAGITGGVVFSAGCHIATEASAAIGCPPCGWYRNNSGPQTLVGTGPLEGMAAIRSKFCVGGGSGAVVGGDSPVFCDGISGLEASVNAPE
jgi:hypothetical protein